MTARRVLPPVLLAAAAGAGLWFVASLLSGTREAWDAASYWTIFYPLALFVCAFLGYFYPFRSWRWPIVLFASMFIAMCIRNVELGNLWPLGLGLFGILALPGILASRLGAWVSERADRGPAEREAE